METITLLAGRRRIRRNPEQWHELLDRFERSGQTQEQFCTAHDLGLSTFGRWRKRLRRQSVKLPKHSTNELFVELEQDRPTPSTRSWDVELQLGAGMCLRLRRAGC
jgi:putative transposase